MAFSRLLQKAGNRSLTRAAQNSYRAATVRQPLSGLVFQRLVRRYFAVAALVLALSLVQQTAQAQKKETFKAWLSATPADARTRASLAGSGTASAVLEGSKLEISGSFKGLLAPATKASLHSAVAAGVRGPAVTDLTISKGMDGTITGSITLTPEQIESLHKGGLYIIIDSDKAPEGVLWGWLMR